MAQALEGGGGLEQRLVVVVDHVRVGLRRDPLRDLTKQLKKKGFRQMQNVRRLQTWPMTVSGRLFKNSNSSTKCKEADLVHDGVGEVVGEHVEDEAVGSREFEVVKTPGADLPHQNRPKSEL